MIYIDSEISKEKLNDLIPVPGICIFIDMCNSTELKQKDLNKWVLMIKNTFDVSSNVSVLIKDHIIKLIGDELMIYIPDTELGNETYATIFDFIKCILSKFDNCIDNLTLRLKAAIHYCDDVYNISFFRDHNDYYGNGIDLTARLMTKSKEDIIVVSEKYYNKIDKSSSDTMKDISPVYIENFKGFSDYTEFRIYKVKKPSNHGILLY